MIKRTSKLDWNLPLSAAEALEEASFPALFGPEQSARNETLFVSDHPAWIDLHALLSEPDCELYPQGLGRRCFGAELKGAQLKLLTLGMNVDTNDGGKSTVLVVPDGTHTLATGSAHLKTFEFLHRLSTIK